MSHSLRPKPRPHAERARAAIDRLALVCEQLAVITIDTINITIALSSLSSSSSSVALLAKVSFVGRLSPVPRAPPRQRHHDGLCTWRPCKAAPTSGRGIYSPLPQPDRGVARRFEQHHIHSPQRLRRPCGRIAPQLQKVPQGCKRKVAVQS